MTNQIESRYSWQDRVYTLYRAEALFSPIRGVQIVKDNLRSALREIEANKDLSATKKVFYLKETKALLDRLTSQPRRPRGRSPFFLKYGIVLVEVINRYQSDDPAFNMTALNDFWSLKWTEENDFLFSLKKACEGKPNYSNLINKNWPSTNPTGEEFFPEKIGKLKSHLIESIKRRCEEQLCDFEKALQLGPWALDCPWYKLEEFKSYGLLGKQERVDLNLLIKQFLLDS